MGNDKKLIEIVKRGLTKQMMFCIIMATIKKQLEHDEKMSSSAPLL
ncbi:hypothetical protein [Limosilactobacillus sp.]